MTLIIVYKVAVILVEDLSYDLNNLIVCPIKLENITSVSHVIYAILNFKYINII